MTTTTKSPIETAMAINTARRVNYLIDRIAYLARMEKEWENGDALFGANMNRLYDIHAEMADTRKELLAIATK